MPYETPSHRASVIQAVLEALDGIDCAVLTTHINADGDGCGSEVALAAWLRARGSQAYLINPTPYPETYGFLVHDPEWVVDARSDRAAAICEQADVAIILDAGDASRLGRANPMIEALPKVVIDHHQPGDHPLDGVVLQDPTACATGELIYDLVLCTDGPWTPDVVEGIYVAILTDTGSFRFSNASPDAHRIAADLIARGVDPESHYRRVYGSFPMRKLQLLQHSLDTLEVDRDDRVAWMTIPMDAYESLGATPEDLEGAVDYPRSVEGVEVGILFRRTSGGGTKVSFRSNGSVDVNVLARRFGGGGHVKAAGALIDGPLDEVRGKVIEATREAVRVVVS
jgi:bifunctional oligoribonuclease and PAP phosphatase NrnA